jgi:hypothetical protein
MVACGERSTGTIGGRARPGVLLGAAVLSIIAGTACTQQEQQPAAEAVTQKTGALHEPSTVRVDIDLYWFDEGFVFPDDRDMWGYVEIDPQPVANCPFCPFTGTFFRDLESGCCDEGSAISIGRDSNFSVTRTVDAGKVSVPVQISMFEKDDNFFDDTDDRQDISPHGNDLNLFVHLQTGQIFGDLQSDCPNPLQGCHLCSGPPLVGDGVCFTITVSNHCIGNVASVLDICNGVDDDCDSFIDEDAPFETVACNGCLGQAQRFCSNGQMVTGPCQTGTPAPADVACNGIDDDCDGPVDEDFPALSLPCGALGVCAGHVNVSCVNGQVTASACTGVTPPPTEVDTCNGLDDDCDGRVDEDFPEQTIVCGPPGACAGRVTTRCQGGQIVSSSCEGVTGPTAEILDGKDNDCDGRTDECDSGQTDFWCCPPEGRVYNLAVNITADEADPANVTPQEAALCQPGAQPANDCTLRGVFRRAEQLKSTTCEIAATLPSGVHSITQELRLEGGRLSLFGASSDARVTSIESPNRGSRIILVLPAGPQPSNTTLRLGDLTIANGRPVGLTSGGGILALDATILNLDNVIVRGNQSNQQGAGLALANARLTMTDSVVIDNQVDNFSIAGGLTSHGGGMFMSTGQAHIERSAFVNNRASKAAGISLGTGRLELRNSTISGNQAAAWAGGLSSFGEAVLEFNTITNNSVAFTDRTFNAAGGIVMFPGSRLTALGNIIAGNNMPQIIPRRDGDGISPDCAFRPVTPTSDPNPPVVVVTSSNLIGAGGDDCLPLGDPVTNPLIGTLASPVLARLNPLGVVGPSASDSQVHTLLSTSPAIAASFGLAVCPAVDQREFLRPIVSCSLGAYEFNGTLNFDGDGIDDPVDTQPQVFSNAFSDVPRFGNTSGTIAARGDQVVIIRDADSVSQGVVVTAAADGGSLPAQINACGDTVLVTLFRGQSQTITCPAPTSCVFSQQLLTMQDRSDLLSDLFSGGFSIGFDATIAGNVLSRGNGFLNLRSTIFGNARLTGTLSGNRAGVGGTLAENASVAAQTLPQVQVTAGSTDVTVPNGVTQALAPGSFRDVLVRSGGTLDLTGAGVYRLRSLRFEPDAFLNIVGGTSNVTVVAVSGTLAFGDRFKTTSGGQQVTSGDRVLFYTNGTTTVDVGSDVVLPATLRAPLAAVQLRDRSRITGCVGGRTLTVGHDATAGRP